MIHITILLLLAALLSSISHADITVTDTCVGDLNGALNPAGYPCKKHPLTSDDFVFTKLRPGNVSALLKASAAAAFVKQFPGVNGLGIAASRIDFEAGGV